MPTATQTQLAPMEMFEAPEIPTIDLGPIISITGKGKGLIQQSEQLASKPPTTAGEAYARKAQAEQLRKVVDMIEKQRKSLKAPILEGGTQLDDKVKEVKAAFEQPRRTLMGQVDEWNAEQDRIEREATEAAMAKDETRAKMSKSHGGTGVITTPTPRPAPATLSKVGNYQHYLIVEITDIKKVSRKFFIGKAVEDAVAGVVKKAVQAEISAQKKTVKDAVLPVIPGVELTVGKTLKRG